MRLPFQFVLCAILLAVPRAVAAQCGGVERWPVKVGSDTAAATINVTNPLTTLLHDLIALPRPSLPSDDVTRTAAEREVRVIDGRLRKFKLESGRTGDQDYHLVITDDTLQFSPGGGGTQPVPHSFIAEIVHPDCIAGRHGTFPTTSQFQTQIVAVRQKFEQAFPEISGGWNEGGGMPIRVTGVAFFDRPHGQTGRAMNGLEIHPVLDFELNGGAPPDTAAASTLLQNPGFEAGSQGWTATAAVITTDAREPARSGTTKAWLGGYSTPHTDRLSQQVSLPAAAQAITLKFFLHISTEEQQLQQFDTLTVQVKNASGQVLQTLKTFSNLQAAPGYHLQTLNLSAFKGQTIRIELVSQEDNGSMTSFVVDDFVLIIET